MARKPKRGKSTLIRDSFTIPDREYAAIDELKERYLGLGIHLKKSEILRAGLLALTAMDNEQLNDIAGRVERIKPGRPKKS